MRAGYERTRAMARPSAGLRLKHVALGVIVAFLAAFVLAGIVGLVVYQGWLSEIYSPLVMNIVSFLSLFFGGVYAGRRAGVSGLLHGGLTGFIYIVLVSALGLLLFDQLAPTLVLVGRVALALVLGGIGGTIGINLGR